MQTGQMLQTVHKKDEKFPGGSAEREEHLRRWIVALCFKHGFERYRMAR